MLFLKIIQIINCNPVLSNKNIFNNNNRLPIPLYMTPTKSIELIVNFIEFLLTGIIIILPFYYLKNVKYHICSILGIILALNHFKIYDNFLKTMDLMTPITWSKTFLNLIMICLILFLNCLNKKLKILTTSLGASYISGYILYLILNVYNQYVCLLYMLGFLIFYILIYFLSKKIRKFIMFSLIAGWNFYSCANILTSCLFIGYFYNDNLNSQKKGKIILIGFVITTFIIYSTLRLIFYKKNHQKINK